MGGEETDKVKENILESLVGNKTVVVIRERIEAIKEERKAKGKGSKEKEGREYIEEKSIRERVRVKPREHESYIL